VRLGGEEEESRVRGWFVCVSDYHFHTGERGGQRQCSREWGVGGKACAETRHDAIGGQRDGRGKARCRGAGELAEWRRGWSRRRTGIYTPAGRICEVAGNRAVSIGRKARGVKGNTARVLRRSIPGERPGVLVGGVGDDSAEAVLDVLASGETAHAIDQLRSSVVRNEVARLLTLIVQGGQFKAEQRAVRLVDGDRDRDILARGIICRSRDRKRTASAVGGSGMTFDAARFLWKTAQSRSAGARGERAG